MSFPFCETVDNEIEGRKYVDHNFARIQMGFFDDGENVLRKRGPCSSPSPSPVIYLAMCTIPHPRTKCFFIRVLTQPQRHAAVRVRERSISYTALSSLHMSTDVKALGGVNRPNLTLVLQLCIPYLRIPPAPVQPRWCFDSR